MRFDGARWARTMSGDHTCHEARADGARLLLPYDFQGRHFHLRDGLIAFPGGVSLKDGKGNVAGVIGVSGSSVENDHAAAVARAEALGK